MDLHLDPGNGVPLYIQLKEALKYAIATGTYAPGTQLPTVRQTAVALKINVNTVNRAYAELEREQIIISQQGRGTFVCDRSQPDQDRRREFARLLEQMINECYALGFSLPDIIAALQARVPTDETAIKRQGGAMK